MVEDGIKNFIQSNKIKELRVLTIPDEKV